MRSNMLEIMDQDFITMGRLVGYNNWRLLILHAARNALLPVLTALTLGIGYSIGGDVGLSKMCLADRHRTVLVGAVTALRTTRSRQARFIVVAVIIVALNFIADVLYILLDPRIGASEQARAS